MHPFIPVERNWCVLFNILPLRKRKYCRGANASSTPKESGIEHAAGYAGRSSAKARKTENAFKEKEFQCLTDPVNLRGEREDTKDPSCSLSCFNPWPPSSFCTHPWFFLSFGDFSPMMNTRIAFLPSSLNSQHFLPSALLHF